MITFGSERLREIGHLRFRQGSAFADFFDTSFDVVHFTKMHPQFDELDRGRYGKDSWGELRLGRISTDTIDVAFIGAGRCLPMIQRPTRTQKDHSVRRASQPDRN